MTLRIDVDGRPLHRALEEVAFRTETQVLIREAVQAAIADAIPPDWRPAP